MILIAHRGNFEGANFARENHPDYIDEALQIGYDAEIDLRVINNTLLLGHDNPDHIISEQWLDARKDNLWIHCKNYEALAYCSTKDYNYFWHENDAYTLTSWGYGWVYPGNPTYSNSVMVMVETVPENLNCYGLCLDDFKKVIK